MGTERGEQVIVLAKAFCTMMTRYSPDSNDDMHPLVSNEDEIFPFMD